MDGIRVVVHVGHVIDEEVWRVVLARSLRFDAADHLVDFDFFQQRYPFVAQAGDVFERRFIIGEKPLQRGGHQPRRDLAPAGWHVAEIGS